MIGQGIGGYAFIHDYQGIPYKFGGRGRDGVDCYGLLVLVFKERLHVDLPDWLIHEIDLSGRSHLIKAVVTSGSWVAHDHPADCDVVVCKRTRASYHVGIYFGGGVLHAVDGMGVVYEPLSRFVEQYPSVEFGEWQP